MYLYYKDDRKEIMRTLKQYNCPGIYSVHYRNHCIYVGGTKNLLKRVQRFWYKNSRFSDSILLWGVIYGFQKWNVQFKVRIISMPTANLNEIRFAEKDLIRELNPILNVFK